MKLLPYRKIQLTSPLSKKEAIEKLKSNLKPGSFFSINPNHSKDGKKFVGEVINDQFEIYRIINYGNSFLPKIIGKIETDHHQITIHVTFKLHILILIITLIWSSIMSITFIASIIASFYDSDVIILTLFSGFMLCFLFGLLSFTFFPEVEKTNKEFIELFDAKIK